MNKLNKILKLTIGLSAILLLLFFVINSVAFYQTLNNKIENKIILKETNFSQIQIHSFGIYNDKTSTLMAVFNNKNNNHDYIYTANRIGKKIDISNFGDKTNLKIESINIYKIIEDFNDQKNGMLYLFDIIVEGDKLYISYVNYYNSELHCDSFNIVSLNINPKNGFLTNAKKVWKGKPCLHTFGWQWHGFSGRLSADIDNIYIVAGLIVTDIYGNIYPNPNERKQESTLEKEIEKNKLFGSLIKINKKNGEQTVIASGFRSPGGLFNDFDRNLFWVTDHGPRGGDELNLIKEGMHFGWPYVSLGDAYIKNNLEKLNTIQTKYRRHDSYELPHFYWTPSIGISQIIVLKNDFSDENEWKKGDLVVSSLKENSLFHIKLKDDLSVISIEPILIGHRIRSLVATDKRIYMSTDDGQIMFMNFNPSRISQGPFPTVDGKSPISIHQNKLQQINNKITDRIKNKLNKFNEWLFYEFLKIENE
jgi:hypothetical protein